MLFSPSVLLGNIPEELDIEELKQRAKSGDSKAQTEVKITHTHTHTSIQTNKYTSTQNKSKLLINCTHYKPF